MEKNFFLNEKLEYKFHSDIVLNFVKIFSNSIFITTYHLAQTIVKTHFLKESLNISFTDKFNHYHKTSLERVLNYFKIEDDGIITRTNLVVSFLLTLSENDKEYQEMLQINHYKKKIIDNFEIKIIPEIFYSKNNEFELPLNEIRSLNLLTENTIDLNFFG